jgi:serine protease inhibitor
MKTPAMKTILKLSALFSALLLAGPGCSQEIEDPVFDYNLKSARVIETNNSFGLDLFQTVLEAEDAPNVMISPASVSIALGMAYNGAETTTREAFEQVLHYEGLTRQEVNEITGELMRVLVTNVKGNLLEVANSMWSDEGFQVRQEFIDLNREYYDAEVTEIDLQTAEALAAINKWVSDQTHGKIDRILEKINPETVLILLNAIYFNCIWETEFDPKDTKEGPFFTETGLTYDFVDMMTVESTFNAAWTEEFTAVELPYKNGKFSMYLFLPSSGTPVSQLVEQLDGPTWSEWLGAFTEREKFRVTLPKFRFDFERSLAEDLKAMGLEIAFTGAADFSGITPEGIFISDVIHKTYIDVNEEGTEAAAVTAVIFDRTSSGENGIRLDRPFLFAITENSSKSIVFIGKVAEPAYDE